MAQAMKKVDEIRVDVPEAVLAFPGTGEARSERREVRSERGLSVRGFEVFRVGGVG